MTLTKYCCGEIILVTSLAEADVFDAGYQAGMCDMKLVTRSCGRHVLLWESEVTSRAEYILDGFWELLRAKEGDV